MANFHHKGQSHLEEPQAATALLNEIDSFLRTCRSPAVLEYGDQVMPLRPGEFSLEVRSERLWIDVWHETRSLSRRILAVRKHSAGTLDCAIHKFGGAAGTLSFLDLDRPQTAHRRVAGERRSFGEQFRQMLSRQFPGWELKSLSSGMDLQRSFSPLFPRARLLRGQHQIAAIACPDPAREPGCLTFALLWFAHVTAQGGRKIASTSLHIFLPERCGALTAQRLRWLVRSELRIRLFLFNDHGSAGEVDPADLGNIDTAVKTRHRPPNLTAEAQRLLEALMLFADIGICPEVGGEIGIRFRGLEFARIEENALTLGIDAKEAIRPSEFERVIEFARHLQEIGGGITPQPERWLESSVRAHVASLDPTLRPSPLHSQVLSLSGRDRNTLDLLGLSHEGRLTVLELKAEEDIHLPLQALDYWIRVSWHARRGEMDHLFPGASILPIPPRLLLVAPALSFHPSNETVLRYFSPEIDVERIGINSDWQTRPKVVLRLRRGDPPQSHQLMYEHPRVTSHQEGGGEPEPGPGSQAG